MLIGTTALVLVLSVFNGFEGLVKSLYSSFYTDIKITAVNGKVITVSSEQLHQLKRLSGVKNFSLVAEEKALLENGESQSVIYLKGVDENYRYTAGVANHIVAGNYDIGNAELPKLILGAGVEGALGMRADIPFSKLRVYLPSKGSGETEQIDLVNDIISNTISTSAVFVIQQDFDNKYGITNIDFVKQNLRLAADEYGGIEIALKDPSATAAIKKELAGIFGAGYLIQNKYEQNRNLYSVMSLERWMIYAIACLILMVAAFNMIGALRMLSLEKQKDIKVLHAMGASKGFIQKIFLNEGMLLALIGGGSGMLLAFLLAWLQINYHLIPLQGGSFLIDYFPVKLLWRDFVLVGVTVIVIALIASWSPSRKAASQDFSLRSE